MKKAKWLLKVTLLISLSAFSGYTGAVQQGAVDRAKTELVISANSHPGQCIQYLRRSSEIPKKQPFAGFYKFEISKVLLISEGFYKVAYDRVIKRSQLFTQSHWFQPQKTTPQTGDQDTPRRFIG